MKKAGAIVIAFVLTALALGCYAVAQPVKGTAVAEAPAAAEPTAESAAELTMEAPTPIALKILMGETQNLAFGGCTWRVLVVQDGRALIITEGLLPYRPYNETYTVITWETCTLRKYLNGEFYNSFTEEERGQIAETIVTNSDNLWYGTEGGSDTTDRIFLLSLEEVDGYFGDSGDYLNERRMDGNGNRSDYQWYINNAYNDDRKVAYSDGTPGWWWLRSPGGLGSQAACVDCDGKVDVDGSVCDGANGVRPALWLKLNP